VSVAIEDNGTVSVGDWVFVLPHEGTPDHLHGIQGTVVAVEGVEAQLRPSSSDELLQVEVAVLRRERRRRRVPSRWDGQS
jgi:hypothetical protein